MAEHSHKEIGEACCRRRLYHLKQATPALACLQGKP
jgi:hypothetical protein